MGHQVLTYGHRTTHRHCVPSHHHLHHLHHHAANQIRIKGRDHLHTHTKKATSSRRRALCHEQPPPPGPQRLSRLASKRKLTLGCRGQRSIRAPLPATALQRPGGVQDQHREWTLLLGAGLVVFWRRHARCRPRPRLSWCGDQQPAQSPVGRQHFERPSVSRCTRWANWLAFTEQERAHHRRVEGHHLCQRTVADQHHNKWGSSWGGTGLEQWPCPALVARAMAGKGVTTGQTRLLSGVRVRRLWHLRRLVDGVRVK